MSDRESGRIKWFSPEKGFGFVEPDDPSLTDIFIHKTQVPVGVNLDTDVRIEFSIEPNQRNPSKLRAVAVKLLS